MKPHMILSIPAWEGGDSRVDGVIGISPGAQATVCIRNTEQNWLGNVLNRSPEAIQGSLSRGKFPPDESGGENARKKNREYQLPSFYQNPAACWGRAHGSRCCCHGFWRGGRSRLGESELRDIRT